MLSRRPPTTTWVQTLIATGVLTISGAAVAQSHNVSSVNDSTIPTQEQQAPTRSGQGNDTAGMADASPDRQPGMNDRGQADTMNTGQAGDYGSANYQTPPPTDARDPMKDDPVDSESDQDKDSTRQPPQDRALPDDDRAAPRADGAGMDGSNADATPQGNPTTDETTDRGDAMNAGSTGASIDD